MIHLSIFVVLSMGARSHADLGAGVSGYRGGAQGSMDLADVDVDVDIAQTEVATDDPTGAFVNPIVPHTPPARSSRRGNSEYTESSAVGSKPPSEGAWTGTYFCNGIWGITRHIGSLKGNTLQATDSVISPGGESGVISERAFRDPATGVWRFVPVEWIGPPIARSFFVSDQGLFTDDTFDGVVAGPNCGSIHLRRT
jgi:hypothetical protein